jgi:hypothetical protein
MSDNLTVNMDEIDFNGETYVKKSSVKEQEPVDLSEIVLIRTYSAGVHFGTLKEHDRANQVVVLTNAKRLHYWDGSCSLSQVAVSGVGKGSRISVSVPEITLARAIEIIPMSKEAATQMMEAKEWK